MPVSLSHSINYSVSCVHVQIYSRIFLLLGAAFSALPIGVGAQSTLGGMTFLPEKMYENFSKCPNFYVICPKNARFLHNNCQKKYSLFLGRGTCPLCPPSPTPMVVP